MTQRLNNAKEAASKPAGLQSHEDLAKKLQVIPIFASLDYNHFYLHTSIVDCKIFLATGLRWLFF